jgi:hypothetical protein
MKCLPARRRHWKVSSSGAEVLTITALHKLPVGSERSKMGSTDMSGNLRGQELLAFLEDQMEPIPQIAGFRDAGLSSFRRGFWVQSLKPTISRQRTTQRPELEPVKKEVLIVALSPHRVKFQQQVSFTLQGQLLEKLLIRATSPSLQMISCQYVSGMELPNLEGLHVHSLFYQYAS